MTKVELGNFFQDLGSSVIDEIDNSYKLARGYFRISLKLYEQSLNKKPRNLDGWMTMSKIQIYHLFDFKGAIKTYTRALKVFPKNAKLWNELGNSYLLVNDYEDSIDAFKIAIDIDDGKSSYWTGLGRAYCTGRKYREGLKATERAIELEPENESAWIYKGRILKELQEYEEAIKSLNQCLEICDNSLRVYQELGDLYSQKGEHEKSIFYLEKILDENPNDSLALRDLGIIYCEIKELHKAKELLNKTHFGNTIQVKYWLIRTHLELGEDEKALSHVEEIVNRKKRVWIKGIYDTK